MAGPPSKGDAATGDWIGGVLLGILLPVIGLIAGVVYLMRGGTKRQVGALTVGLSLLSMVLWVALTSSH